MPTWMRGRRFALTNSSRDRHSVARVATSIRELSARGRGGGLSGANQLIRTYLTNPLIPLSESPTIRSQASTTSAVGSDVATRRYEIPGAG